MGEVADARPTSAHAPLRRCAIAGVAAGAVAGTTAVAAYLATVADVQNPFIWRYITLFGTLPGLLVGGSVGAVAGAVTARRTYVPSLSTSGVIGALAAVTAAAVILAALTGGWMPRQAVALWAAATALVPGLLAGLLWRILVMARRPYLASLVAAIVVTLVVAAAQLALYASMEDHLDNRPESAYPSTSANQCHASTRIVTR